MLRFESSVVEQFIFQISANRDMELNLFILTYYKLEPNFKYNRFEQQKFPILSITLKTVSVYLTLIDICCCSSKKKKYKLNRTINFIAFLVYDKALGTASRVIKSSAFIIISIKLSSA